MIKKVKKSQYHLIRELCQVIDCEHKTAPYIDSSNYFVVRTNNVRNGILILNDIKCTTKDGFIEWTKRGIPRYGDVLFTREAPAGESCLVPNNLKICMGQRMVLLRPNHNQINPNYLCFYLTSEKGKREIYKYSIGSTVTRINIDDILKIKVYCPSIAEQEEIAKFLGECDRKLNLLRRKKELLETYKRGVMQKIFSQQIRFKNDDGSNFPDWQNLTMKDITKINQGLQIAISDRLTKKLENSYFYITNEFLKEKSKNYFILNPPKSVICNEEDILMTRTGNTGQVVTNVNGAFHNNFFKIKYDKKNVTKKFLFAFLTKYSTQCQILRLAGTSTIPDLNHSDFYSIKISIPDIKEQEKIANFLTAIDKKIEAVRKQIEGMEKFKQGLLQKMFV